MNIKDKLDYLFKQLVPLEGNCNTIEGEVVRAINKIGYRWYNDGDYYFQGYGCETAGPAHAFLVSNDCPISQELKNIFDNKVVWKYEEDYENGLEEIGNIIVKWVESKNGEYTKNEGIDMLSYEPHFYIDYYEDGEDDMWEEDTWDEDDMSED